MRCHFRTKRNRLIGSRRVIRPMWFHSLSVSRLTQPEARKVLMRTGVCVSRDFSVPFCMSVVDRVSTSTFRCISRYCIHIFRGQYAGQTRVNYSYAYAKLPKVFGQFHWRRARTSVCTARTTMHAPGSSTVDLYCLFRTYICSAYMSVIQSWIYADSLYI